MRRKRRNHSPVFKAQVALASVKGDKTLAELAAQFDIHANQIPACRRGGQELRRRLLDNADALFGRGLSRRKTLRKWFKSCMPRLGS